MTKIFNKASEKEKRRKFRKQMPKAESLLWQQLRGKQLNGFKFRRQFSVNQYVLDFYCPEAKLAIEVDGDSHFDDEAMQYDRIRQQSIEALGIHFLRFTNDEVFQSLDEVLKKVLENIPSSAPLP